MCWGSTKCCGPGKVRSSLPHGAVNIMGRFTRALAALIATSLALATPAVGHVRHRKPCSTPGCIMARVAARHGWDRAQVQYEWRVLYHESTTTPQRFNLYAVNGDCWGSGQLMGGPAAYTRLGGDPYSVEGQIVGDLAYVAERYGTPARAWQHELTYGWY